jgi:hypothetical protein
MKWGLAECVSKIVSASKVPTCLDMLRILHVAEDRVLILGTSGGIIDVD